VAACAGFASGEYVFKSGMERPRSASRLSRSGAGIGGGPVGIPAVALSIASFQDLMETLNNDDLG
jgi:hypothetical protein